MGRLGGGKKKPSRRAGALGLFAAALVAICIEAPQTVAQEGSFGTGGARVEQVLVEGNRRIEDDTIRSYMTLRAGDVFDPEVIDESLKSLFATGLFADVTMAREGQALVVQVVENPIINRVAFEGNDAVSDETLEAEIQLLPRMVYTRTRVQSDVQRLIDIYRRQGRFAATVEPKVIPLEQNRVDLVFEIDEGPVTGIEKITFIGNDAFSDGDLRDIIATKESAFWRIFSTSDSYDPDRLSFDRELLRRHYLAHGYADFRVVSAVAELSQNRENFYVTFTIEEGVRYRVGAIEIVSHLRDLDGPGLMPLVTTETGDWYNADKVESSILNLTNAVGDRGYAFIDIVPRVERNLDENTIDVVYEINEGPRTYVERIDIRGNSRTLDHVVRREFRLAEGDAFNTARFRRSQQRIENLGYFSTVNIEAVPGSAPDKTVIVVDVEEQATGQVNFGLGFSSVEGPLVNFGIGENNLLGGGQSVSLNGAISGRRTLFDLRFTEPYFMGKDISTSADIFRSRTDFRREASFDQAQLGSRLRGSYALTERLRHQIRYGFRRDDIKDIRSDASRFVRDQEGVTTRSVIGTGLTYDGLDNRLKPTDGDFLEVGLDLATIGGSERWIKQDFSYSHFIPVTESWVLALRAEEGYIHGLGRDVEIADRFFLGSSKLRGFDTAGTGPRDVTTNDALGGNFFYVGSIELTIPLGISAELPLSFRTFADAGSLFDIDQGGVEIVDESSPRAGVGFGISYESPFGLVGIDLTQAVVKEDFDETEVFRINFGTQF